MQMIIWNLMFEWQYLFKFLGFQKQKIVSILNENQIFWDN